MQKNKNNRKILIRIDNLKKYFQVKNDSLLMKERLFVKANENISINIYEGETFGLVGESGCGKSTLGRTLLQLYDQTEGRTLYYGRDVDELAPEYVLQTLTNLVIERKNLEVLRKREADLRKEYEALPQGEEKSQILVKLENVKKEAENLFLDIVQLIGGFFIMKDLAPISEILVREYKAAIEYRKLKDKQNEIQVLLNGNISDLRERGASKSKIDAATLKERKILEGRKKITSEKEKELKLIRADIYKMMEPYKKDPDFLKYEAYRDKGIHLAKLKEEEMRRLRKDLQIIFQDPYSSLNPRMTVGQIISEGLLAHRFFDKNDKNMQDYVLKIMEKCGLAPYFIHRYPHQFSGGQRQRIGIARALALKPKFVVCDEAVSALDVSIQSQIINLLLDLKEQENLTYLFISHDLRVIKYISDRIGVMYLGNIVELAETEELFARPTHPYTDALLSAIPTTDAKDKKEAVLLEGDIPSPIKPPSGCKFNTRCRYATDQCMRIAPKLEEIKPGHYVACHHKLSRAD